ncbi:hypothetical protein SUGI_0041670 [Cryptomeria japonica]|nr:hypothetical protein SUGI_0041670 [Cryptomeria japonica]
MGVLEEGAVHNHCNKIYYELIKKYNHTVGGSTRFVNAMVGVIPFEISRCKMDIEKNSVISDYLMINVGANKSNKGFTGQTPLPWYGLEVGLTNYVVAYCIGLSLQCRMLKKMEIDDDELSLSNNLQEMMIQMEESGLLVFEDAARNKFSNLEGGKNERVLTDPMEKPTMTLTNQIVVIFGGVE